MSRLLSIILISIFGLVSAPLSPAASQYQGGEEVFRRVSPSVAIVLTGEGAGRVSGMATGVILRSDGIIFTAYHAIKNAQEVQVRLPTGEVFDRVELVGVDERRDVAALRIHSVGLPALAVAPSDELDSGQILFVISNPEGLAWSMSSGVLSAIRMADEIEGAGTGYRVVQFTASVSPGSSGGVVVDFHGRAVGIIVATHPGGQNINFAVPVESVLGLADGQEPRQLGAGNKLELPKPERPPAAAAAASADPKAIARSAKTVYIYSKSEFAPSEPLETELAKNKEFKEWSFVLVKDHRTADLIIRLDRPLFTWDFTFSIEDRKTSVVLGSGKIIAWDGVRAAPGIAKEIIGRLKKLRENAEKNDK